jgi:hypothetical protein
MVEAPQPHPFLLRLATRLLAKAERSAGAAPPRLKLDLREAPELHDQIDAEAQQRHLWLLEDLCRTGWTALRLAPAREFATVADRNPQLELLQFDALAAWAGYTPQAQRWQAQWLRHLESCWPPAGRDELREYLARNPLVALHDMPLADATRSLEVLQATCASGRRLPLREASALAFQGRSKILDNREELLRVLGAAPGQFSEPPIQLLVQAPERIDGVLFVENLVTFERMADRRAAAWATSLLVYAAGFRGSARRLRSRESCRLYLRANPLAVPDQRVRPDLVEGLTSQFAASLRTVEDWLFGSAELPVFFFGDLDFAGMQILASLRAVFDGAHAWQPGYAQLAAILESGGGHAPEQASKELQSDPGNTGCLFADGHLLPLMRRQGRFVDQEAFGVAS